MLNSRLGHYFLYLITFLLVFTSLSNAAITIEQPSIELNELVSTLLIATPNEEKQQIERSIQSRIKNEYLDSNITAVGETVDLDFDLVKEGDYSLLEDGREAYAIKVRSPGAEEVILRFDYKVSEGSQFLAYSDKEERYFGQNPRLDSLVEPLTLNNARTMTFTGDTVNFIYIKPALSNEKDSVILTEIVHFVKTESIRKQSEVDGLDCNYSTVCSVVDYYDDISKAVVKIYVTYTGQDQKVYRKRGTGTLINSYTTNPKKSYVLTADHVLHGIDGINTPNLDKYYLEIELLFNNQTTTCDSKESTAGGKHLGAHVVSRGFEFRNKDYALLDLGFDDLHTVFNINYAGWLADIDTSPPGAGVYIHHGQGKPQQLAVDHGPFYKGDVDKTGNDLYIELPGDKNIVGKIEHGLMTSGSSGSGLFGAHNKLLYGIYHGNLHKGEETCAPNKMTQISTALPAVYDAPNEGFPSLRSLLDPDDQSEFFPQISGYFPNGDVAIPNPPWIYTPQPFDLQEGVNIIDADYFENWDQGSVPSSCKDGLLNGDEVWMDCGGSCEPCDYKNYCYGDMQNTQLEPDAICADPNNPPLLNALGGQSTCSPTEWMVQINGTTLDNSQPMTDNYFDYSWNGGQFPDLSEFPYVEPILVRQFYWPTEEEPGTKGWVRGGYKWFAPTIYRRAPTPSVNQPMIGTCPSSPVTLEGQLTGNNPAFGQWQGDQLGLLSNPNATSTNFQSAQTGTYDYHFSQYMHENYPNACSSNESVTIQVEDLIATEPTRIYVGVGQQIQLPAPISGDFEENSPPNGYQYNWSPPTGLENINKKYPILTAPLEPENNVLYQLTVSKGNSCSATGKVWVDVKDGPFNLQAKAETSASVKLTWEDWSLNGMVKIFVQRRLTGVGSWYNVAVLQDGSLTEYLDKGLEPGGSYEYRLQGVKPNFEGTTTYSNWVSVDLTESLFTKVTMLNVPDLSTGDLKWADYDNDGDLDFWMAGKVFANESDIQSEIYTNKGMQWKVVEGEEQLVTVFDDAGFQPNTDTQQPPHGLDNIVISGDWGDYDRDGYLDLVVGGWKVETHVFRNQSLTPNHADFEIVWSAQDDEPASVVGWAHISRDHALDIVGLAEIYSEKGGGFHEYLGNDTFSPRYGYLHNLSENWWGETHISTADYDNDGDTDFLITGTKGKYWGYNGIYTGLHSNKWNHNFLYESEEDENWNLDPVSHVDVQPNGLVQVTKGESAWGDYDQDGDLDLVIAGAGASGSARIYRNDGNNQFTEIHTLTKNGNHLSWVDYDQDGDLDLFLSGASGSYFYKNKESNFIEVDSGLPSFIQGAHDWGDYDNDGDLDLLIMGGTNITRLYRNELISKDIQVPQNAQEPVAFPANTRPDYPSWFSAVSLGANNLGGENILFRWGPGSDAETPPEGLTYNLHAEHTETGYVVKHGMTKIYYGEDKWKRTVARPGNVGHSFEYVLHSPVPLAELKWWIQSIDTAFRGSKYIIKQGEVAYKAGYSLDVDDGNYVVCNGSTFPVSLVQQYEGLEPEQIIWEASGSHTVEPSEDGYSAVVTRKEFCELDEAYCDIAITANLHYLDEDPDDAIELTGTKEVPGTNGVYDTVDWAWIEHEGEAAIEATLMPPTNGGKEADHIYWLSPPEGIERIGDYHSDQIIFKAQEGYEPAALCGVELTANAAHECGPNGNFYASAIAGQEPLLPQMLNLQMIETSDMYGEVTIDWVGNDSEQWLVVMREGQAVNQQPVYGENYNVSTIFGAGDDLGDGNYVVHEGNGTAVKVTGLVPGVEYHVEVFVVNLETDLCHPADYYSIGVASKILNFCPSPDLQLAVENLQIAEVGDGDGVVEIIWDPFPGYEKLIIMSEEPISLLPMTGKQYVASNVWGQGDVLDHEPWQPKQYVVGQQTEDSLMVTGLTDGKTYYVGVFVISGELPCFYYLADGYAASEITLELPPADYVMKPPVPLSELQCPMDFMVNLDKVAPGLHPNINWSIENVDKEDYQLNMVGQGSTKLLVYNAMPTMPCQQGLCLTIKAELVFDVYGEIVIEQLENIAGAQCNLDP